MKSSFFIPTKVWHPAQTPTVDWRFPAGAGQLIRQAEPTHQGGPPEKDDPPWGQHRKRGNLVSADPLGYTACERLGTCIGVGG